MRRVHCAVTVLALVAGCAPTATARLEIATGPSEAIRQAASAARECGIAKLRIDPLDDRSAMLLVDPKTPPDAIVCLREWVRARPELTTSRALS